MEILRKHKIGIICGGWSSERAISLKSGYSVCEALMKSEYNCELIDLDNERTAFSKETYNNIDIAFILVHGRGGEDGKLQNFFENINLNFTGSDSKSSNIGMDMQTVLYHIKNDGIIPINSRDEGADTARFNNFQQVDFTRHPDYLTQLKRFRVNLFKN